MSHSRVGRSGLDSFGGKVTYGDMVPLPSFSPLRALLTSRFKEVLSRSVSKVSECLAIRLCRPDLPQDLMIRRALDLASLAMLLKGRLAGGMHRMTPALKNCMKAKAMAWWFSRWDIGVRDILSAALTALCRALEIMCDRRLYEVDMASWNSLY